MICKIEAKPGLEPPGLAGARPSRRAGVLAAALAAIWSSGAGAGELDQLVAQRMDVNEAGVQSQARIDTLSDQSDKLAVEYRGVLQRIDALRVYNHQVSELISSQDDEIESLRRQIDDVELIGREITPLMLAMIAAFENFVELDVPFLQEERATRVTNLSALMTRADVTDAERYRRITEAYQIENEYGRTIEAYQGELEIDGQMRQVDFLRVGRVVFLYQTLDGATTGVWDQRNKTWSEAPDYRVAVRDGLRMARKQTAPDLLKLPVPTAETVQ
jgi:vacuolar-type H+-ATPase subunit I/STV1